MHICMHVCHVYVRERHELTLNSLSFTYLFSKYLCFHKRSGLKLMKAEKFKYEEMDIVNTGSAFLMSMFWSSLHSSLDQDSANV